jgi:hypothetical protein
VDIGHRLIFRKKKMKKRDPSSSPMLKVLHDECLVGLLQSSLLMMSPWTALIAGEQQSSLDISSFSSFIIYHVWLWIYQWCWQCIFQALLPMACHLPVDISESLNCGVQILLYCIKKTLSGGYFWVGSTLSPLAVLLDATTSSIVAYLIHFPMQQFGTLALLSLSGQHPWLHPPRNRRRLDKPTWDKTLVLAALFSISHGFRVSDIYINVRKTSKGETFPLHQAGCQSH